MKAVEFRTRLKNNTILIPEKLQSELKSSKSKKVHVIVLMDESEVYDETDFRELAREQFLKGYDKSDSIYDEK